MYNTRAGEHRCHHHSLRDGDHHADEDPLLLACSVELPLPLAKPFSLLDATGQGIVGNGQDWRNASVELLAATTSSPSTIFRDTRLLLHLALFRRRPLLCPLLQGSTVHLTSLNIPPPPVPLPAAPPFRSSSFIDGRFCSFCLLVNSLGFRRAFCYTHTYTQTDRHLVKDAAASGKFKIARTNHLRQQIKNELNDTPRQRRGGFFPARSVALS